MQSAESSERRMMHVDDLKLKRRKSLKLLCHARTYSTSVLSSTNDQSQADQSALSNL